MPDLPTDIMSEGEYAKGDGNNSNKVDHAINADKLGGKAASLIASKDDVDNAIKKAINDSWAGEY